VRGVPAARGMILGMATKPGMMHATVSLDTDVGDFKLGTVVEGEDAGCPCLMSKDANDGFFVLLKEGHLFMRSTDCAMSEGLPVAIVEKLSALGAKKDPAGTFSVGGRKVPFVAIAALVERRQ
jgi:hypothetical protein